MDFLTRKVGPFPMWVWLAGMTLVGGYFWYKRKKTSDAQAQQQAAAQQAASQAASTSAAAPYQPYTVPYVASSTSYGNGYSGIRQQGPGPQTWQPPSAQPMGGQPSNPGQRPGNVPASQPPGGTRSLGKGYKIVGQSGNYGLVGAGAYNNLGSGVTSLSQADSRAQQYGAP